MSERSTGPKTPTPDREGGATPSAWSRLYRMARPRATRTNFFALALAALLGFAIATQVTETADQSLETLREEELVRILDDVTQNGERLEDEIAELEQTRDQLRSASGSEEAIAAAQERLDTLGILAGTVRATGPGITVSLDGSEEAVSAATLIDTMQELRDAGAEAMQVDDVRVVASTYFTGSGGTISADGVPLTRPYTFKVIGDPQTLSSALEIPGGISESVRGRGGTVSVAELDSVSIDAVHEVTKGEYARPVPEEEASE